MKIIINSDCLQFVSNTLPLHQVEEGVVQAGLKLGGKRLDKGVELPLSSLGINKNGGVLFATVTVSYHDGVLQLYANPSDRKSLQILRFLKAYIAPVYDLEPWRWWHLSKLTGKVSLLQIRIPNSLTAPSSK